MNLILVLDFVGTLVFALTGALKGLRYRLDLLGILVLAVFTGLGGGILRDLVLNTSPPLAFQNEVYFLICIAAAVLSPVLGPRLTNERWWNVVQTVDAFGLAVFAAQGSLLAWKQGFGPIGVMFLGTLTAVGGGVIRDLLVKEIPAILVREVYATAAAAGSMASWAILSLGWGEQVALALSLILTLVLRILGMVFHWQLPRPQLSPRESATDAAPVAPEIAGSDLERDHDQP